MLESGTALTERQREIAHLACDQNNGDIADALYLSVRTVESHLAAAFRKLGINARAELVEIFTPGALTKA